MSEFKVDPSVTSEIEALKASGEALVAACSGIKSSGISGMKTAVEYEKRRNDIITLLKAYRDLIVQDTQSLNDIVQATQQLDKQISNSMDSI